MKAVGILSLALLGVIGGAVGVLAAARSGGSPSSASAPTAWIPEVMFAIRSNGALYVAGTSKNQRTQEGLRVLTGPLPAEATDDCGNEQAVGHGFVAFSCESGGGGTRYGHPQELLVVRPNGSFSAYPTNGQPDWLAESPSGEVIDGHNGSIVEVTASGLRTLVSQHSFPHHDLGGDLLDLSVDRHGDVFVAMDYYAGVHRGCGDVLTEHTSSGKSMTLWQEGPGLVCG